MIGQKVLEGRSIKKCDFGLSVGETVTPLGVHGPPVGHTDAGFSNLGCHRALPKLCCHDFPPDS